MNYKVVDSVSYNFYINKKWDSLIHFGKKAIRENIDYFYLDYRIGVSYFEKKNYRKAIKYFENALKYNNDDNTTIEYLYYSYLLSNREPEAKLVYEKLPSSIKDSLRIKQKKLIDYVYFEAGPGLSNNENKNGKIDISGKENIYGEIDKYNNFFYGHFGLAHSINKRISIYHGYSNLTIDKQKEIWHGISSYNTYPNPPHLIDKVLTSKYKLNQNSYYLSSKIQLNKGFSLIPAFHFINDKYSTVFTIADSINSPLTDNNFRNISVNINNYIFSFNINKDYPLFNFGLIPSFSVFNKINFIQLGLNISYFPFGNTNLVLNTTLTGLNEIPNKNKQKANLIFKESLVFKLLSKTWITLDGTFGDHSMYNENNGLLVYNTTDKIKYKCGINLLYLLTQKIELSLMYQLINKENDYFYYMDSSSKIINKTYYQNNLIIIGIKWKL